MKRFCFLYNPSTNRQRSSQKWEKLKDLTESWPSTEYWVSKNRAHLQKLAAEGNTRQVDLGQCNDFFFINTLGFGFDGQTNLYASQSRIKTGTLRYILAALKTIRKMEPFKASIHIDDPAKIIEEDSWIMITVANGRVEGGNFVVAPQASLFDGLFNLLTVNTVNKWMLPFLLPLFLAGHPEISSKVNYHAARSIRIQFDRPVNIHTDGEQINTLDTNFRIRILPGALNIIC